MTDDLGGVMEDWAAFEHTDLGVRNPVQCCLEMYAQPIRQEMALTLTLHLSKQSSSVFMNSNEICFFASDILAGTSEIQSVLSVSRSTCIIIVAKAKKKKREKKVILSKDT